MMMATKLDKVVSDIGLAGLERTEKCLSPRECRVGPEQGSDFPTGVRVVSAASIWSKIEIHRPESAAASLTKSKETESERCWTGREREMHKAYTPITGQSAISLLWRISRPS